MRSGVGAVMILVLATVVLAGCNGEERPAGEPPTEPTETGGTVSDAELQEVVRTLQEVMDSTPEAIADDVNALGPASVNPEEVSAVAYNLCVSGFNPDIATSWLDNEVRLPNALLLGPSQRLLRLAGSPGVCAHEATSDESQAYDARVYGYLSLNNVELPQRSVSDETSDALCQVLGSQPGGAAVEEVLGELISVASRNRVDADEFLPVVVETVGATCSQWLPVAQDALQAQLETE